MKKILSYVFTAAVVIGVLFFGRQNAEAVCLGGFQGGTGLCAVSSTAQNQFLQVASTSPYLTYGTAGITSSTLPADVAYTDASNTFTGLNTFGGGNASATISNILATPTVIPNFNSIVWFPTPTNLASGNCPGYAGVTGKDICLQDLYNSQLGVSSGTLISIPGYLYASSTADTPVSFSNNQETVSIEGVPGEGTVWGWGNATNTAEFTWNVGSSINPGYQSHVGGYGIFQMNLTNDSGNASATAILWGGTHGAEGFVEDHNIFRGWYYVNTFGANTFIFSITYNRFIDNQFPIYYVGAANSGENAMMTGNLFGDAPVNPCQVITGTLGLANFQYNDFDDCQQVIATASWQVVDQGDYWENPATASSQNQAAYPYIVVQTSTTSNVALQDIIMVNDNVSSTTSTAPVFLQNSANVTGNGIVVVANGNATTVAAFASNSITANTDLCNLYNVSTTNSAFANVFSTGGAVGLSFTPTGGVNCVQRYQNNFVYAPGVQSSNSNVSTYFGGGLLNRLIIPSGGASTNAFQDIGPGTTPLSTLQVDGTLAALNNVIFSSSTFQIPNNTSGQNYFSYTFAGSASTTWYMPQAASTTNRLVEISNASPNAASIILTATSTDSFSIQGVTTTVATMTRGTTQLFQEQNSVLGNLWVPLGPLVQTYATPSIGGGSLTAGTCASTTIAIDSSVQSSTAGLSFNLSSDAGADFYTQDMWVAAGISVRVCAAGITGTPNSSVGVLKITR